MRDSRYSGQPVKGLSDSSATNPPSCLSSTRPCRHLKTMSSYPPGGDYDERLLDNIPKATKAERQVRPLSP